MNSFKPLSLIVAVFCLSALATAHGPAEKMVVVDSGAFGIYVHGARVATETFQIRQGSATSTATSELKLEGQPPSQRSELQITSGGDLLRYEWHELSPGKAQIVVEPSEDSLIAHITPNPPERPVARPFILPASTMVLDDYVFSQREILVWRYFAQACGNNLQQCRPGRMQFGVLVPQQQTSSLVTMEYAGLEKVMVHGAERELSRVNLKIDDVDWIVYLDAGLKVVRMLIPSEQTEVVRD